MATFLESIRGNPASFRGLKFAVIGAQFRGGRKNAIHEYPFRDIPYVEDLGRQARRITVIGFVLDDANGTAISKRNAIIGAIETQDQGELNHPTLGRFQVNVLDFETEESMDEGGAFALRFTFMESGGLNFPSPVSSTQGDATEAIGVVSTMSSTAYVSAVRGLISYGTGVVDGIENTANSWITTGRAVAQDATSLLHAVVNLPGAAEGLYGRLFSGKLFSGIGNLFGSQGSRVAPASPSTTIQTLQAQNTVAIANISSAELSLSSAASDIDPSATAAAAQAYANSIQSSTQDPEDGVRLLSALAVFVPPTYPATSVIGNSTNSAALATGDLFRRSAIAALAQAALVYQPSSYDDAISVRGAICTIIDNEIEVAGDQGEDDVFLALRQLRATISADLAARGASLAPIKTFTVNQSLPAPVLALRFYRDPTRSDELTSQISPIHPAFCPTTFQALAE
jgi:prophage DNA circulation protein